MTRAGLFIRLTLGLVFTTTFFQISQAWSPYNHHISSASRSQVPSLHLLNDGAATAVAVEKQDQRPELLLFNSKSRTKEPLRPIQESKVSMYTCGPTVYDYAHVGNFRAFLTYDLIKRVLLYFGYDVDHVCNLTDVDDKIINRANEQGIDNILDLTRKFEGLFLEDLKALNVLPANKYPRATEHIDEMMEIILGLEAKGLAYEADDGSWYFATNKQKGYGKQLVDLNWDQMETSTRGEDNLKRSEQDFCLWKAFKPGVDREDASWESSKIQKGRPGWHLECSAMARKYLGDTIDIHGGGVDLKFPHHENEIAQSEGFTGETFCNCWLHNGFVNINNEKMSKSLGNFLTLRTACPNPQQVRAYRYLVISSQYRNPLSFTPEVLAASLKTVKRIDRIMTQMKEVLDCNDGADISDSNYVGGGNLSPSVVSRALENFEIAILDDLSTPRASASLFTIIKAVEQEFKAQTKDPNYVLNLKGIRAAHDAMLQMDRVFGIFYKVPLEKDESDEGVADVSDDIPDEVLTLVTQRSEAKNSKNWELADSLRSRITELGYAVKDVKGGEPEISKIQ